MNYSDTKRFTAGDRVERRLAAILVADVAGYSRLMHADEEATHARLTALLTNRVRAAMAFQDSVYMRSAGDALGKRILFRVGINIGDIIVGAHDIFGDGVNIAARLEGLARPGGICLSASAYD